MSLFSFPVDNQNEMVPNWYNPKLTSGRTYWTE